MSADPGPAHRTPAAPAHARRLFVLNPNCLQAVTDAVARAVQPFAAVPGIAIECRTVQAGPPGIVTQADADSAIGPLHAEAERLLPEAAAFVIACYSDPGLHGLRERFARPVFGIGECALLTACTRGQRIGVIAIARAAIPRHLRAYAAMGLAGRVAGERAIDLPVQASADPAQAAQRLREVGRLLQQQDGADVLVLGCAGMAAQRAALEQDLGLPVVDPCQAAVAMAIGALLA